MGPLLLSSSSATRQIFSTSFCLQCDEVFSISPHSCFFCFVDHLPFPSGQPQLVVMMLASPQHLFFFFRGLSPHFSFSSSPTTPGFSKSSKLLKKPQRRKTHSRSRYWQQAPPHSSKRGEDQKEGLSSRAPLRAFLSFIYLSLASVHSLPPPDDDPSANHKQLIYSKTRCKIPTIKTCLQCADLFLPHKTPTQQLMRKPKHKSKL